MKRHVEHPREGVKWYEIEFALDTLLVGVFRFEIQAGYLINNPVTIWHRESHHLVIGAIIITTVKNKSGQITRRFMASIGLGTITPVLMTTFQIPESINENHSVFFEIAFDNFKVKSCRLDGTELEVLPDKG